MPDRLKTGVLYVSSEYEIAIHLCPCGCGSKVKTPLGPSEWKVYETPDGPTMYPSIGNWQYPCQTHYFIRGGKVVWAPEWPPEEIELGRLNEESRRSEYYEGRQRRHLTWYGRLWKFIRRKYLQFHS